MITTRLRTIAFLVACAVLGWGLWLLLHRMQMAPPKDLDGLTRHAQDIMVHAGKGLSWVLLGAFIALLVVLWNSSALSQNWLDVLAFAFKGFGALVLLLLIILFLHQYQLQKVIETTRESDAKTQRDKRENEEIRQKAAEQTRERNRERVTTLLRRLAEHPNDPAARKITIAVAGSLLRDEEVVSLSLAQALHATALYDHDESVRACARDMLYPIPPSVNVDWSSTQHGDFAELVTRLLEKYPELYQTARYLRYAKVVQSEGNDQDLNTRLGAVASRMSSTVLADTSAATSALTDDSSVGSPAPTASATPSEQRPAEPQLAAPAPHPTETDATARGIIMAVLDPNPVTQEKALDLLVEASHTRVETIISSLPVEAKSDLPPTLYVHVAEKQDLNKVSHINKKLQRALLQLKRPVIILKPIWVGEILEGPKAPSKTEVRYYQASQSGLAGKIQSALISAGITEVRIYQAKATAPRDLEGQMEVWFAKDALKSPN